MRNYYPDGNPGDGINLYGYSVAQTLVQVLKQCGDDIADLVGCVGSCLQTYSIDPAAGPSGD